MQRAEIAIIGAGPAGLSAALTASLRGKSLFVIGNDPVSKNVSRAARIDNYLGFPAVSGEELEAAFRAHISQMGITVIQEKVNAVYAMGDYFSVQGMKENYEAQTVILAAGKTPHRPYPGEEEYLGRGVSYCATCDAALYRDKTVAVVGFSEKEEEEAAYLAGIAKKVYYFPQYGEAPKDGALLKAAEVSAAALPENAEVVFDRPLRIEGGMKAERLVTAHGAYAADGVFLLRENISAAQLVPGLAMKDNAVAVNRQMETNLKGCFACGDMTGAPYQYMKAAGEGNVAAHSAVRELARRAKEKEGKKW